LSQLKIMADQHINQAHPPTKVEVITCYEDVRLSIPEKKFSEELEAAEKLWMEKGYVLYRDSTEEEKRVFGLTADLNQPLLVLTLMMGTGMQELQQQSRQLTANDEEYFSFFLVEMAITVVMKVMQSIPYYANEDLLLYFNQKVTPTLDWVLSSSASADADIVDSSSAGDISKSSISSNSGSRPDLSQYKVQLVVTGDRFVIDDIGYTPLLFSSLTLGSILNIDGKMSSVFDTIPEIDAPDEFRVVTEKLLQEFITSCSSKIARVILNRVGTKVELDYFLSQVSAITRELCSRLD